MICRKDIVKAVNAIADAPAVFAQYASDGYWRVPLKTDVAKAVADIGVLARQCAAARDIYAARVLGSRVVDAHGVVDLYALEALVLMYLVEGWRP